MRALLPIMVKEFRHILRDRRSLVAALLLPLLMLLLFGFAISLDVRRVDIAVVDHDRSPASRSLVSVLTADGSVRVRARPASAGRLEELLESGRVRLGLVLPRGFGAEMAAGGEPPVQVLVDGSDASFAGLALTQLSGSLRSDAERRSAAALSAAGLPAQPAALSTRMRVFFNEPLDSRWFIVPGLIAIIIMQLAALLTSQCVAREYERHTIEQILVSPVGGAALMLGKLLPYVALGIVQVGTVTAASRFVFHVPIRGSLGLLALATLLYLAGSMALGLMLSSALKSQQLAMQVSAVATMLPSLLLSGFIFPLENMPAWLRALSYAVPARYYVEIARGLFLKGVGLEVLRRPMAAMVVYAAVLLLLSISRFRRSLS